MPICTLNCRVCLVRYKLEKDGYHYDDAFDDILRICGNSHQIHDIADQRKHQSAYDCLEYLAFASGKACAADYAGGDRVQFLALADRSASGRCSCSNENSAKRGQYARYGIYRYKILLYTDTGKLYRLDIASQSNNDTSICRKFLNKIRVSKGH